MLDKLPTVANAELFMLCLKYTVNTYKIDTVSV